MFLGQQKNAFRILTPYKTCLKLPRKNSIIDISNRIICPANFANLHFFIVPYQKPLFLYASFYCNFNYIIIMLLMN